MNDQALIKFKADLDAFAKRLRIGVGAAMKAVSTDVAERVRDLTPVDSGRARDNWNISVGAPDESYDEHKDWKRGEAHAPKPLPDLHVDGTQPVFITNNAPYILLLEHGSSSQAPNGMAALAVAVEEERAESIIEATVHVR